MREGQKPKRDHLKLRGFRDKNLSGTTFEPVNVVQGRGGAFRWARLAYLGVIAVVLLLPSVWLIVTVPPLWKDVDAYVQVTYPRGVMTICISLRYTVSGRGSRFCSAIWWMFFADQRPGHTGTLPMRFLPITRSSR